jgi:hypothetical protein
MHRFEINTDQKKRIREWFEQNHKPLTVLQFLLALDYLNNYGYSLEVACPLALDSYKVTIIPSTPV